MSETRQNCCRLCLAPDSECISILNSYAADKEPLPTKIHNCVSIKITSNDRLSLRICHACISYLNSWQSFKNRCIASQIKQRNWLDADKRQQLLDNNVSISTISSSTTSQHQHQQHQQHDDNDEGHSNLATSILDGISSLKKRKSLTVYPLPAVEIKDEPLDADDDYGMKHADESDEMMDPTLFLERTEEEGEELLMDSSNYEYENDRSNIEMAAAAEVKEASCRACNLKFSTRANARRHERNLHPNLFELSTESPNNTLITKPTPALAAALELQRAAAAAAAVEASKMSGASGITPQKYRQEVVNAFNKCETGGYDYENPEKYQDYLTDEKIVFLQQNEEFLQQYQNMTCRCCKKFYATYKNFMAHMRKKYATLPRNLCFNCLKLNDSKALFISHLKRRNCINLYKLLHALMDKSPSFAAAVAATAAAAPEKLRAKELLVNKMYECKLCPKQFRLKLEFRTHVYEDHADAQKKDISQKQCSFCGMELEDPAERKRHYNNMDCIVMLRCVTCDAKFDNHQKFLDHVYDRHLAGFGEQVPVPQQQMQRISDTTSADNLMAKKLSFGLAGRPTGELRLHTSASGQPTPKSQYFSRMPQACPICDQQYNNYNNVLRHMESKHPDQLPQTYKCVKCGIGFPRLSNLREHMVTEHVGDKTRHSGFEYIVNADAVKIAYGSTPAAYTGRYDYVMKDLMSITNGGTIADDDGNDNNESAAKKIRLDMPAAANVSANTSSGSGSGGGSGNMYSGLKECPICSAVFSNNIGLSNHMRSHTAAAQSAAAAANRSTPNSLVTAAATNNLQQPQTSAQQAIFKRNLEQAADRRFRRMRCRICQRRFSSKKSYRFHMLNDHQIRNVQFIKCKLCDAEFAYEKGLKVHMFKIHNTLLKDEMIIKQYECDICSIVYRTEEQLLQHKKNVHGAEDAHAGDFTEQMGVAAADTSTTAGDLSGISTPVSVAGGNRSSIDNSGQNGPLYWYQCKYCPSNFNTNKKLAIHINSHEEFDSNDYSCKDCGNVYSGRKSLWVHRYKKHPQIAEPSECILCKKIFFDTQMLENHIPTCNRKPITATGAMVETATGGPIYKHKTGDDDDDEVSHDAADEDGAGGSGGITTNTLGGGQLEITPIPASNLKIKLPEVACTMCGQRFTDQELFAKHIQMHEMELYTDNPLAAMFDTGPADPNQFYLDRVNDNGEYACDLCAKTFTQMTALKVHRKWHFRGDSKQNQVEADHTANAATAAASAHSTQTPISHQHLLGLQAVGLMPNPRPSSKSQKRKRELKCEYCPSTFISNNNLRRHIYELHKDEIGNLPEPPKIETDEYLFCRRCKMKFETKLEWIEHKVADARITKPFGPFQWGCDLCGAYVSRKEKLINHIHNHMKERVIVPVEQQKPEPQQQLSKQQQQQQQKRHQADGGERKVAAVKEKRSDEDDDDEEEEEEESKSQNNNKAENDDDDEDDDNDKEEYEDAVEYDAGDVEDDDAEEEVEEDADYEEEDAEEADELVVNDISENANDGGEHAEDEEEEENGDAEEENIDDADDDDEEEDDDGMEVDEEDGDVEDTNDDETNEAKPPVISKITIKPIRNSNDTTEAEDSPSYAGEDDDDDEDADSDDSDADTDVDTSSEEVKEIAVKTRYSCDLCRLFFDTQQELQKHVKMHFLNGPGSVSLTEIKPKSGNKSRSSSSDIVTVSSS